METQLKQAIIDRAREMAVMGLDNGNVNDLFEIHEVSDNIVQVVATIKFAAELCTKDLVCPLGLTSYQYKSLSKQLNDLKIENRKLKFELNKKEK